MKKKEDNPTGSGAKKARAGRPAPTVDQLFSGISKGDTGTLARAITLVESAQESDREKAQLLIERCLLLKNKSIRLGITGVPGVGKSTFIEALGAVVTRKGMRVAVLAVDPSSSLSKGSIMGDKTRMPDLAKNPLAFIRPTPAGEHLGGVARNTRETMVLCESAGYELILVETVGVGQSETAVHSMVDFFLLLQLAGAGDELQGIKRGIVEMADAIVINKADKGNVAPANDAKAAYERALQLYPAKENGWKPRVLSCSSLFNIGITEVWQLVANYSLTYTDNGYLAKKRKEQNKYWFRQTVEDQLSHHFYSSSSVQQRLAEFLEKIDNNTLSPFRAANLLIKAYQKELK